MKVLITSSRMPFALGMVRKLAAEGREIYAADDHLLSPGNHSKYLADHFVYPSPRSDTASFLAELEADRPRARDRRDRAGLRGGLLDFNPDRAAPPVHPGLRLAVQHPGPPAWTREPLSGWSGSSGSRSPRRS